MKAKIKKNLPIHPVPLNHLEIFDNRADSTNFFMNIYKSPQDGTMYITLSDESQEMHWNRQIPGNCVQLCNEIPI